MDNTDITESPVEGDRLTFEDLGVSPDLVKVLADQGITEPFAIQASPSPTPSPAATCAARPRPARARPSPSACRARAARAGRAAAARGPRARPHPRAGRSRCTTCSRRSAKAVGSRVVAVYGGADMDKQIKALAERRRGRRRHARPPDRPARAQGGRARRRRASSCSTRPTAWPTWASCPRSSGSSATSTASTRRCCSPPRSTASSTGSIKRYQHDPVYHEVASRHGHRRRDDPPLPRRPRDGQGEGGGRHRPRQPAARSSSPHQARAPTAWPRALERRGRARPPPSTATCARASARSALERLRRRASSPVLVATDVAARGLHIDDVDVVVHYDPPETTRPTCTARAAPPAPASKGLAVTLVALEPGAARSSGSRSASASTSRSSRCSRTTPASPTSPPGPRNARATSALTATTSHVVHDAELDPAEVGLFAYQVFTQAGGRGHRGDDPPRRPARPLPGAGRRRRAADHRRAGRARPGCTSAGCGSGPTTRAPPQRARGRRRRAAVAHRRWRPPCWPTPTTPPSAMGPFHHLPADMATLERAARERSAPGSGSTTTPTAPSARRASPAASSRGCAPTCCPTCCRSSTAWSSACGRAPRSPTSAAARAAWRCCSPRRSRPSHVRRLRHLPARARPGARAAGRGRASPTSTFLDPRDEPLPTDGSRRLRHDVRLHPRHDRPGRRDRRRSAPRCADDGTWLLVDIKAHDTYAENVGQQPDGGADVRHQRAELHVAPRCPSPAAPASARSACPPARPRRWPATPASRASASSRSTTRSTRSTRSARDAAGGPAPSASSSWLVGCATDSSDGTPATGPGGGPVEVRPSAAPDARRDDHAVAVRRGCRPGSACTTLDEWVDGTGAPAGTGCDRLPRRWPSRRARSAPARPSACRCPGEQTVILPDDLAAGTWRFAYVAGEDDLGAYVFEVGWHASGPRAAVRSVGGRGPGARGRPTRGGVGGRSRRCSCPMTWRCGGWREVAPRSAPAGRTRGARRRARARDRSSGAAPARSALHPTRAGWCGGQPGDRWPRAAHQSVTRPVVEARSCWRAHASWSRGEAPHDVVQRLWARDVDPLSVATTEVALALWAGAPFLGRCAVGDALLDDDPWPPLDVVVGNPPFLSPLFDSTGRSPEVAHRLRARSGEVVGPYTDTRGAVPARRRVDGAPGGTVALIQPVSMLTNRDAAAVRAAVERIAAVREIWCRQAGRSTPPSTSACR